MKTVAIIQARTCSARLPGKVLLPIHGKPAIQWTVDRISKCAEVDQIVVATTENPHDKKLADLCDEIGVSCFRGSENDVLDRYYQAARFFSIRHGQRIVRLTGDCPFIDPTVCDAVIRLQKESGADYVSNTLFPSYPDGLDCEVFLFETLEKAWHEAKKDFEREHVTQYIIRNPELFTMKNLAAAKDLSHMRWTLDQPEDYLFLSEVARYFGRYDFSTEEIVALLGEKPSLKEINSVFKRNESLEIDIRGEQAGDHA